MVWFKVDDGLAVHTKPRHAGLPAMGLWTVAGAWCSDQTTDGQVATWYVDTWPQGRKLAERLVQAGLWHARGHACPDCPPVADGWVFHQWHERNPTAEQVAAERAAAAERQRRARDRAKSHRTNPDRHGVTDAVTHTEVTHHVTPDSPRESRSPRPDPTRPDPKADQSGGGSPEPYAPTPPPPKPSTSTTSTARPRCARHTGWPDDRIPACPDCRDTRRAAETAAAHQAQTDARHETERQTAIRACQHCDADGWRIDPANPQRGPTRPYIRCDHTPHQQRPDPEPADTGPTIEQIRAQALTVPCDDPDHGCGEPIGARCIRTGTRDREPLPDRIPAHHTRIRDARTRTRATAGATP